VQSNFITQLLDLKGVKVTKIVSSCCRIIKVKGIPYPFDTKPAI